ncbi:MAG TPA: hypothetical protein VIP05_29585, partial [Burkholderiaceae bacterium]
QGDADDLAPVAELRPVVGTARTTLVQVPGGTHADTFEHAKDAMIAAMQDMVRAASAPPQD